MTTATSPRIPVSDVARERVQVVPGSTVIISFDGFVPIDSSYAVRLRLAVTSDETHIDLPLIHVGSELARAITGAFTGDQITFEGQCGSLTVSLLEVTAPGQPTRR